MDNYMTENKIPELLGNLMKNLAVSKPEDPIEFMIELLTKSDKRSDETKEKLLREVFDELKRQQSVSTETSIQTEGFRYLKDGEEVEFEIHESDKGPQAVNVTGPDGTQLERIVGHGGQDDL
eukprot:g6680.t1